MPEPIESHPLSNFLNDHRRHLDRLRATGRPEVLTVDGREAAVIQDIGSYRRLLELLDDVDAVRTIRERLGQESRAVPADEALAELRLRFGIDDDR